MYDKPRVAENMMRMLSFEWTQFYLRDIAVDYDSKLANNIRELDV